ncbi:MAG: hypothetical protein KME51_20420 [Candidatus Thiodiazotropha sp. (ex Ctena orbiculata)]|nr:hypothetical protein [Candidatus Thiodiazotropha taylori]
MVEVSSLVALIVAEVFVGLLVLSGLLLFFTLMRKGRIRKAAAHLAERVQSDKANREQRLKVLLQDNYKLADSDLEQTLHNMMQTEMQLYQNVINGFVKDDQVHLQQLDVDVENLVLSYQGLGVPDSVGKSDQGSVTEDSEDIAKLKEENERLSEELRVTMDTMGRMLNEYSTMFSGGAASAPGAATQATDAASDDQQSPEESAESALESGEEESSPQPTESTDSMMDDLQTEIMASAPAIDTEIPDFSAEEIEQSSYLEESDAQDGEVSDQTDSAQNASLDEDAAETDEDVSEIIDEVMELADEMIEESDIQVETEKEPEPEPEPDPETDPETDLDTGKRASESMVDDLEKIDIEIPDEDGTLVDSSEFEAGSLEEEWAKLLEEDAENSKKQE